MWLNSSSLYNNERVLLEEDALSLRDLPENEENQTKKESPRGSLTQEEFDFCSCVGSLLKDSEICSADEVFFQGQMLPLHCLPSDRHNNNVFKGGATYTERGLIESSSSTSFSQQISALGIRNQFRSQPSPTTQVQFSKIIHRNISRPNPKPKMWSHFRVGLVKTPEIALQDLKIRCNKDFISQNSTSSRSSNSSSSNDNRRRIILSKKKKQRKRVFPGSCKSVEIVPNSKVVTINRASTNMNLKEEMNDHNYKDVTEMTENKKKKQIGTRHRTFEWLKLLSLESPAAET
ncbi:PREDICTED: uncharacterized protein LOC109239824 [Nicotiana attenuata]|uniref:Uncharacterized protein n=1 Tax=Nicotiana attenuata TaxID=49451 RepID=A0A1J6J8J3_NICAT|nr:PREDICTED: uncharacterized protein LOC109239824 [Nicotiana attenuata]OIT07131.1 hypothetical protein A4A49_34342 [Nicotiana attenuata]